MKNKHLTLIKIILIMTLLFILIQTVNAKGIPTSEFTDKQYEGNNEFTVTFYGTQKYYKTETGVLKDINTTITSTKYKNWDYQIITGPYKLLIKKNGEFKISQDSSQLNFQLQNIKIKNTKTNQTIFETQIQLKNPIIKKNKVIWELPFNSVYYIEYNNNNLKDVLIISKELKELIKKQVNLDLIEEKNLILELGYSFSSSQNLEYNKTKTEDNIYFLNKNSIPFTIIKAKVEDTWIKSKQATNNTYTESILFKAINSDKNQLKFNATITIENPTQIHGKNMADTYIDVDNPDNAYGNGQFQEDQNMIAYSIESRPIEYKKKVLLRIANNTLFFPATPCPIPDGMTIIDVNLDLYVNEVSDTIDFAIYHAWAGTAGKFAPLDNYFDSSCYPIRLDLNTTWNYKIQQTYDLGQCDHIEYRTVDWWGPGASSTECDAMDCSVADCYGNGRCDVNGNKEINITRDGKDTYKVYAGETGYLSDLNGAINITGSWKHQYDEFGCVDFWASSESYEYPGWQIKSETINEWISFAQFESAINKPPILTVKYFDPNACTYSYNNDWIINGECYFKNTTINLGTGKIVLGADSVLGLTNSSVLTTGLTRGLFYLEQNIKGFHNIRIHDGNINIHS